MADKELLRQLNACFNMCKPIFIAMGDEVRLTIITVLATEALTGRLSAGSSQSPAKASDSCSFDQSQSPPNRPRGLSVKEITNTTKLSRPAISHHLKILKNAGLVDSIQSGTSNIYYITFSDTRDLLYELTDTLYKIKAQDE